MLLVTFKKTSELFLHANALYQAIFSPNTHQCPLQLVVTVAEIVPS